MLLYPALFVTAPSPHSLRIDPRATKLIDYIFKGLIERPVGNLILAHGVTAFTPPPWAVRLMGRETG